MQGLHCKLMGSFLRKGCFFQDFRAPREFPGAAPGPGFPDVSYQSTRLASDKNPSTGSTFGALDSVTPSVGGSVGHLSEESKRDVLARLDYAMDSREFLLDYHRDSSAIMSEDTVLIIERLHDDLVRYNEAHPSLPLDATVAKTTVVDFFQNKGSHSRHFDPKAFSVIEYWNLYQSRDKIAEYIYLTTAILPTMAPESAMRALNCFCVCRKPVRQLVPARNSVLSLYFASPDFDPDFDPTATLVFAICPNMFPKGTSLRNPTWDNFTSILVSRNHIDSSA
ncbi:hypothetical protein FOZ63_013950 [Perkinsus olseni]|uniref:Uncharacterized protein n=1 Tax=Perkinsus olseni TaxID=32597 RepID=A0A7J6Q1A2_PEROL|nr:hypothetical protein FOZ63_013950 [Perkinsus olseni]